MQDQSILSLKSQIDEVCCYLNTLIDLTREVPLEQHLNLRAHDVVEVLGQLHHKLSVAISHMD